MRIRFVPLPSDCLAERVKLYAPDKETPTPLDAVRLRGDLRIFLHAPNAAQELARTFWNWLHEPINSANDLSRRNLEDIFWIGSIFGILDLEFVKRLTNLSQPGVIRTMPYDMYKMNIEKMQKELLKKLDDRLAA